MPPAATSADRIKPLWSSAFERQGAGGRGAGGDEVLVSCTVSPEGFRPLVLRKLVFFHFGAQLTVDQVVEIVRIDDEYEERSTLTQLFRRRRRRGGRRQLPSCHLEGIDDSWTRGGTIDRLLLLSLLLLLLLVPGNFWSLEKKYCSLAPLRFREIAWLKLKTWRTTSETGKRVQRKEDR